MNTHERIARDLAAVLSPEGEADWRQYEAMARDLERRLDRQFKAYMRRPAESNPELAPARRGGHKRDIRLSFRKEL